MLEPGCGSGRLTEVLAARVGPEGPVRANDLSTGMLARARSRRLPGQVRLVLESAASLAAPAGSVDRAICLNVVPHFVDPARVLDELARVLRPGGHLWINHLAARCEVNAFHQGLDSVVRDHVSPDDRTVRQLLEASGFRVEEVGDGQEGYQVHGVKPV